MFLTAIIQSFLLQYYLHHCYLVGMKIKTALLGLIYEKVNEGKQVGRREERREGERKEVRRQRKGEGANGGKQGKNVGGRDRGMEGR